MRAVLLVLLFVLGLSSCEDFLNPYQDIHITDEQMFDDWYEYRAAEMGMYALQQELVEQLFILGELRGDLVNITQNATSDMIEVYNFNISRNNKYASPTNLFKLIAATNNFISVLEKEHPEVLDKKKPINNYDRLYGEALCMRAWAYFNGVRIYGKMPFIPSSLESIEEIESFVNSSGTYIDSVHITFPKDGYPSAEDSLTNVEIELEKQYFDIDLVIDHFSYELEEKIKAVGVNHAIENSDDTWEVSIWNDWARHALLGHMYLTQGDLARATDHFEQIIYNTTDELRYQLDETFQDELWIDMFKLIDNREHIYTIWFNKANFQQNTFQAFFENQGPHKYMLKPSYPAILNWETEWRWQQIDANSANPIESEMLFAGIPSDFYRGIGLPEVNQWWVPGTSSVRGASYIYSRNGVAISEAEYFGMLMLRAREDFRGSEAIMEGMDTLIYKYSIEKDIYDQDANYNIYRAAGIHLYLAEIYGFRKALWPDGDFPVTNTEEAELIINNGRNYPLPANDDRPQLGVRGRIGMGTGYDIIDINSTIYKHDPFTNEILGYTDYSQDFEALKHWFEAQVNEERARELAFEGERFYDLVRVAERRGGHEGAHYLADLVSRKFPSGQREMMYNLLLDRNNWYINYFNDTPISLEE